MKTNCDMLSLNSQERGYDPGKIGSAGEKCPPNTGTNVEQLILSKISATEIYFEVI